VRASLILRKFVLVTILAMLTGCTLPGSVATGEKVSDEERGFSAGVRLACNIKHKKNTEYCNCFVNTFDDITPPDKKRLIAHGGPEAEKHMLNLMLKNRDKFNACDSHWIADLSIPDVEPTSLAKRVLDENNGSLLTPKNLDRIETLDKSIGYEFQLHEEAAKPLKHTKYTLSRIDGGKYYFDYINIPENTIMKEKYMWSKGVKYVHIEKNDRKFYRISSREDECMFTLGECTYKNYKGKKEKVFASYKDGLWVYNVSSFGKSRSIVTRIYDIYGLPIYRSYKASSGGFYEKYRVEGEQ